MSYVHNIIQSNTITFARACLAASVLGTLVFTPLYDLFPLHHLEKIQAENMVSDLNFFFLFNDIGFARLAAIAILIMVIAGMYPRITCLLHSWVTYSYFHGMLIVEGGDQINAILTLLLIPICILDNRMNAWRQGSHSSVKLPAFLYDNAKYATYFICIQMSVLYLNAGVAKAFETEWYNGTAVYYWFYDQMFGASPWLQQTLGFLFKNGITVSLINWGVIGLEISLFVALFLRQEYKYLLFTLGFFFHFAIVMVHGLTSFWLAMTGGIILYLFRLDIGIKENLLLLREALLGCFHISRSLDSLPTAVNVNQPAHDAL